MLLWDKTGGEKLLSIWWLFTIVLVGAGIVIGVSMFYSAEVDVRNVEAEILLDRIMDCIFEQGMLIEGLLENGFDIFSECKLNKEIIENEFYFKISVLDNLGNKLRDNILEGVLENACNLKNANGCVERKRSVVYDQDNKIKKGRLEIWTASNQIGERISLVG